MKIKNCSWVEAAEKFILSGVSWESIKIDGNIIFLIDSHNMVVGQYNKKERTATDSQLGINQGYISNHK